MSIYHNGRHVIITGWVKDAPDVTIRIRATGAYRLVPMSDLMADRGMTEIRIAATVAERNQKRLEAE